MGLQPALLQPTFLLCHLLLFLMSSAGLRLFYHGVINPTTGSSSAQHFQFFVSSFKPKPSGPFFLFKKKMLGQYLQHNNNSHCVVTALQFLLTLYNRAKRGSTLRLPLACVIYLIIEEEKMKLRDSRHSECNSTKRFYCCTLIFIAVCL